ncbi:uncharacterized protein slc22a21 isoform X2 [Neoarius graeffei]|nr:uncharacterized protein slc22a21 isoform X2 [Neoarius graeffei]
MAAPGYEDLTAFLGDRGPFQLTVFLLLSLSIVPNGYTGMAMVFLADTPDFRCRSANASHAGVKIGARDTGSGCEQRVNGSSEPCVSGWEYSSARYRSTVVTEVGLDDGVKDSFYDELFCEVSKIAESETLFLCGDFNGHIGCKSEGYEGVHGGFGYGERNPEGVRILDFAVANDLVINNSLFQKRASHLITYQSGVSSTQVDYILTRRCNFKHVINTKVVPNEECALQHKLLLCDISLKFSKKKRHVFTPKLRVWKLRDHSVRNDFLNGVRAELDGLSMATVEDTWQSLKGSLLSVGEKTCGYSKKGNWRKQTWWWDDTVSAAIEEKRRLYKAWKRGGSKQDYLSAKHTAKKTVHAAKKRAEAVKFASVVKDNMDIFKIAKQIKRESRDVVGECCVRDDQGHISLTDDAKKKAWKEHYSHLLNVEFPWSREDLTPAYPVEGPPILVTSEMVANALCKMKLGKAPGPSGIVAEMVKASEEVSIPVLCSLANAIIAEKKIPVDWDMSYIINLYKGKGDALDRGNYRGLKLTEHCLKVVERVVENIARELVSINEMQFGFMPGRSTTDAIFIVRQLQEKYLAKEKNLYFAFIDLEKAFDRVPRDVLWWAMRRLGLPECLVSTVQAMYSNASSRVCVSNSVSDSFKVQEGVHQGSVLSPFLFIVVLEALSREFRTGCPWELLYADDLVISSDSLEELLERLRLWKIGLESKGLRVNMSKTKILMSGPNLNSLKDSGKHPCAVCRKGVGSNSIFCNGCSHWVHKKCSNISGRLTPDPLFRCSRCRGTARPIDGRPCDYVMVNEQHLEVVDSFRYLGDTICAGGGCEAAIIARVRAAWGKFRELLPLLTCKSLSLRTRGRVYGSCVRGALLYASECWAPKKVDLSRLERNERAMLRWMCGLNPNDETSPSIWDKLEIVPLEAALRHGRLRWFGHTKRASDPISDIEKLEVAGTRRRGRPRKTWAKVVADDLKTFHLSPEVATDRVAWKKAVNTHMQRHTRPQVEHNDVNG